MGWTKLSKSDKWDKVRFNVCSPQLVSGLNKSATGESCCVGDLLHVFHIILMFYTCLFLEHILNNVSLPAVGSQKRNEITGEGIETKRPLLTMRGSAIRSPL